MSDTELLHNSKPEPVRRLEVFTGRRRRTWPAEQKARILAEATRAARRGAVARHVLRRSCCSAVPWSVLEAVIAPHYPKEGPQGGRRAFPIAVMLRIYCLQQVQSV